MDVKDLMQAAKAWDYSPLNLLARMHLDDLGIFLFLQIFLVILQAASQNPSSFTVLQFLGQFLVQLPHFFLYKSSREENKFQ